jgi:speckle-type POZ protein
VSVIADSVNVSGSSSQTAVKVQECNLACQLGNLLDTGLLSDVSLILADGKHFKGHKAILAARSPVFGAMFEHEMEERKNGRVQILDVESDVFKEMLQFIYTGKTTKLKEMAPELLAAADKVRAEIFCEIYHRIPH